MTFKLSIIFALLKEDGYNNGYCPLDHTVIDGVEL
jgi:hypothetical protein